MALTATLTLNQTLLQVAQQAQASLSITNGGGLSVVITEVQPTINPTATALLGTAAPVPTVIAAGQTVVFNWGVVCSAPGQYAVSAVVGWTDGITQFFVSPVSVVITSYSPAPIVPTYQGNFLGTFTGFFNQSAPGVTVTLESFGAVGDGVADDTVALNAAITSLLGASGLGPGGTIELLAKTYRINGQVVLPNDGASPPKQPALRITGKGAWSALAGGATIGGSVLDLRYSGNAGSGTKIDTRGRGSLEIDHLAVVDLGTDSVSFIQTTWTLLNIHQTYWRGTHATTLADQDAIILGGTTNITDGSATAAFQGYGTIIAENMFSQIRRAVYGRTYCNGVVVRDNGIAGDSGTNNAVDGAAFELLGYSAGEQNAGNLFIGNLLEAPGGYKHAFKLTNALNNAFISNPIFDAPGMVSAAKLVNSFDNFFGFTFGPTNFTADATSTFNTAIRTQSSGLTTDFGANVRFFQTTTTEAGANISLYGFKNTATNDSYHMVMNTGASPGPSILVNKAGGGDQYVMSARAPGAGLTRLELHGATTNWLSAPSGPLSARAGAGSPLAFGDQNSESLYWQESTRTLVVNAAAGKIAMGTVGGPTITTGSGVPSAAEADGSIYLRSGAPNGTMYVRKNGAWKEVTAP